MQERITKAFIKKVAPIYGKIFNLSSMGTERINHISSNSATPEERDEYYSYGVTSFKTTAGILAFPVAAVNFASIGIFKGFNIIIPIVLLIFLILLCIGVAFELLHIKNKKNPQVAFTNRHLFWAVLIAILSTIFFSYLLFVGLS